MSYTVIFFHHWMKFKYILFTLPNQSTHWKEGRGTDLGEEIISVSAQCLHQFLPLDLKNQNKSKTFPRKMHLLDRAGGRWKLLRVCFEAIFLCVFGLCCIMLWDWVTEDNSCRPCCVFPQKMIFSGDWKRQPAMRRFTLRYQQGWLRWTFKQLQESFAVTFIALCHGLICILPVF